MKYNITRAYYWILMILGIAGVLDGAFLIAIGTVLNTGVVIPAVLGVPLIIYSYLKIFKNVTLIKNRQIRLISSILAVAFLLSFVIVEVQIYSNSLDESYVDVDYVVLLGGGLNGDEIPVTVLNRIILCEKYLKSNPEALVVVSGGQGLGETISEAEAMKRYLVDNGIAEERIIKEDKSTSTFENFKYTKRILNKQYGERAFKIMVVTNDFHMFRTKMLAQRNGFIAYGMPAQTWWGVYPNCLIREYLAVVKSYFLDKSV